MKNDKQVTSMCEKKCGNEFASCMQMALDSSAMGACYDAEKICNNQCSAKAPKQRYLFSFLEFFKKNSQ